MPAPLIFFLYRTLLTIAFPFLIVYVLWRGLKDRRYFQHLSERFGTLSSGSTIPGGIWLHAVSVGEVISASGLIVELRREFPGRPIYVSCSTLAGRAMAEQRLKNQASLIFYAPFDMVWIVRRVLRKLRPSLLVVLETEIWPNLWRQAKYFGCTLYVINGRISDRALPRYRSLGWFFQPVLRLADEILVQSKSDEQRYLELGARNVFDNGNLKYDFRPPGPVPGEIRRWAGSASLFVAASTMPPDEDDTVIAAYKRLPAGTRMLLAPRKPERFDEAAAKLEAAGIDFVRRTRMDRDAPVLLLDTIGELASCFSLECVVFMGGSIVTWGGHNILEPAFFGRPVICGPYMQNFAEMERDFREAGALRYASNSEELASVAAELLRDPGDIGERGRVLAEAKRGATARAVQHLKLGVPFTHRPVPLFWKALSLVWRAGLALDRAFTKPRRLGKPVVSIGGLAMGGVGKTPFVLWLAGELHARGLRPAILTRGYGRTSTVPIALAPGERASVNVTGDEAQLYLNWGKAAVGIGSNRYETGKLLESSVDVFLLDDGFQHWALVRDIDIVLLDPLDPTAGAGVFPAGLQREGCSALSRADFVVTPEKVATNAPPPGRYAAFCGIGNPASFRRTLEMSGLEVKQWREFPDHHKYSPDDLRGLNEPLITTEKDAANLPPGLLNTIHVLRIRLQIDEGQILINEVLRRVGHPKPY